MLTIFVSMFIFALIGAVSPGPVNIIATSAGANFGYRGALPHVTGATLSYTLIVFLAGISLEKVSQLVPEIENSLKYLGGVFLLYMSYKIATATPFDHKDTTRKNCPPTLLEGALSQGINPKAWLVSMSGVSLFVLDNNPAMLYLMVFCCISFAVCFLGVSTWAAMGQIIGHYLSTRKRQIIFNATMGLLLCSTVFSIFLT